ncbi:hypothetical protein [Polynucleobacter necessarius]|uniref:hypothetical protein n=1 Tax=Polynucleobacter necessarius TaxID=576610 RepID=UPI0022B25D80|nr:hypothetical protein [Polynucleobacter necessarius]
MARIIPNKKGQSLVTQCNQIINSSATVSDENGNLYIVGTVNHTLYNRVSKDRIEVQELSSVAMLHDHDLDQFSELAQLREEACSFGGIWSWQGAPLS